MMDDWTRRALILLLKYVASESSPGRGFKGAAMELLHEMENTEGAE